jgi:hypothetical protein
VHLLLLQNPLILPYSCKAGAVLIGPDLQVRKQDRESLRGLLNSHSYSEAGEGLALGGPLPHSILMVHHATWNSLQRRFI